MNLISWIWGGASFAKIVLNIWWFSLSLSDLGINKDDLDILDDYDIYKNDDGEARMMTEMSVMMMVTVFIS